MDVLVNVDIVLRLLCMRRYVRGRLLLGMKRLKLSSGSGSCLDVLVHIDVGLIAVHQAVLFLRLSRDVCRVHLSRECEVKLRLLCNRFLLMLGL